MRRTVVQPDRKASESAAALESLECELFLKEYEEAYAKLRDDPAALAEFEAERRAFDGTLMDGLEDEGCLGAVEMKHLKQTLTRIGYYLTVPSQPIS
jgi:uncharacterized protein YcgL (UPF0745 family)